MPSLCRPRPRDRAQNRKTWRLRCVFRGKAVTRSGSLIIKWAAIPDRHLPRLAFQTWRPHVKARVACQWDWPKAWTCSVQLSNAHLPFGPWPHASSRPRQGGMSTRTSRRSGLGRCDTGHPLVRTSIPSLRTVAMCSITCRAARGASPDAASRQRLELHAHAAFRAVVR
jgi:hypothetical protein